MVMSYFRPEVEIQPFRACAVHPAIIIGTVRLWTWLWGRYHVPQNAFLVYSTQLYDVDAVSSDGEMSQPGIVECRSSRDESDVIAARYTADRVS